MERRNRARTGRALDAENPALDQPVVNIIGEKVALGPFRRDLVAFYLRWINDFEVTKTYLVRLRPWTLEEREAWYENVSKGGNDVVDFTIYEKSAARPIGYATLESIDYLSRTATLGLLIGEKDCWGKGYGTEVSGLMLDYGFTLLGLHNINLTVYAYNKRGIHAYTRAGFRETGRRREAVRFGGRAYDLIYMDCLASEFQSPVLRRLIPGD
ncbi:MAG TPA: GNAT family protein [Thermomicrobiales bacterium]|nr:GNAT family protein [Thermomicrobiales bacterium]